MCEGFLLNPLRACTLFRLPESGGNQNEQSAVLHYPLTRKSGTFRPIEAAAALVPQHLLDALEIERVPADEVVLNPYLMTHAVEQ